ncbi:PREDICTED: uncharacterized protein LOC109580145 [Amphimedon queenslandica]|uniref:Copper acquisition factor BIM1-like domain-containing protein n=1 Tax=Amphimedon queenslandica TaxID=400682 RepID=A0AAN0J5U9_AMPQE|nr:PREDICTED: uncharacterized protein LOC109580145 [Amphimedon queenslandica]|eukprot:XP_019852389.1 PREDICTED: uncharacterized protein LOC109580145 [Amphimedon queenslandica]
MKFFIVLACLFAYANAHACMLFPEQRGPIPDDILTKSGVDACLVIKDPPCGDAKAEDPKVSFTPGNATVVVIKNLDHFYSQNPGSWELFLWAGGSSGKSVGRFADSSDFKTLDFKAVTIMIPSDAAKGKAILQLIYTTNNPNAPAMFYQCADILITDTEN